MQIALKDILPVLFFMLFIITDVQAQDYAPSSADRTSASIYVYNRIDEDQYPDTNIRAEQFQAQIDEITSGNYVVKPVSEIIDALKNKKNLPDRTIALSFDGGYKSFFDIAYPLLERHDLPYTLFISTDHIDSDNPQYMSWSELRKIAKSDLATIGIMPSSYARIYNEEDSEIRRQINKAKTRYREELGKQPEYFTYPFGEHNAKYRDIVEKSGFIAAFGQQSSVLNSSDDLYSLPRFAMTETFGNISRFRLTANALPLAASITSPQTTMLKEPLKTVHLKISEDITAEQLEDISCFISGAGKADIEKTTAHELIITTDYPVDSERIRLNCTLPLPTSGNLDEKRWRWFGALFIYQRDTAMVHSMNGNN